MMMTCGIYGERASGVADIMTIKYFANNVEKNIIQNIYKNYFHTLNKNLWRIFIEFFSTLEIKYYKFYY